MASTMAPLRLFLLFLLTISLSISSDARPFKPLFVSFSLLRHRTLDSDMAVILDITEFAASDDDEILPLGLPRQDFVASQPQQQQQQEPYLLPLGLPRQDFVASEPHQQQQKQQQPYLLPLGLPRQDFVASQPQQQQQQQPYFGFSYDFSSLRDRTVDILSVVVALLFGVGCGALTAATMYLAFSLCSARFGHRYDFGDEDDDDDDYFSDANKENVNDMCYVKIPDHVAPVKSVV